MFRARILSLSSFNFISLQRTTQLSKNSARKLSVVRCGHVEVPQTKRDKAHSLSWHVLGDQCCKLQYDVVASACKPPSSLLSLDDIEHSYAMFSYRYTHHSTRYLVPSSSCLPSSVQEAFRRAVSSGGGSSMLIHICILEGAELHRSQVLHSVSPFSSCVAACWRRRCSRSSPVSSHQFSCSPSLVCRRF